MCMDSKGFFRRLSSNTFQVHWFITPGQITKNPPRMEQAPDNKEAKRCVRKDQLRPQAQKRIEQFLTDTQRMCQQHRLVASWTLCPGQYLCSSCVLAKNEASNHYCSCAGQQSTKHCQPCKEFIDRLRLRGILMFFLLSLACCCRVTVVNQASPRLLSLSAGCIDVKRSQDMWKRLLHQLQSKNCYD